MSLRENTKRSLFSTALILAVLAWTQAGWRKAWAQGEGNQAILNFTHCGSGLVAKDGALRGFTICGANGVFVAAQAAIVGDTVVVSHESIAVPHAVRYGWANVPDVNLFHREGLPASPFRTDLTTSTPLP